MNMDQDWDKPHIQKEDAAGGGDGEEEEESESEEEEYEEQEQFTNYINEWRKFFLTFQFCKFLLRLVFKESVHRIYSKYYNWNMYTASWKFVYKSMYSTRR